MPSTRSTSSMPHSVSDRRSKCNTARVMSRLSCESEVVAASALEKIGLVARVRILNVIDELRIGQNVLHLAHHVPETAWSVVKDDWREISAKA